MANGNDQRTRYWYKISVDAARGWTAVLTIAVLAATGVYGYRLLARHLLERQAAVAMEEADELVERLRDERNLALHRDKYRTALGDLADARGFYDQGLLDESLRSAQRSRSLLVSIVDALRHRNPSGEAQFVSSQGRVEVRRGERGDWMPARSRTVIYAGDYIKTSEQGSAEVMMLDGTLFTVRPGTVVLVDRSHAIGGERGARSERTLALESGWVNLSTSSSSGRVTTPDAEARVEERSEAVVTYDEQTSRGSFAAHRGRMRVASADGTSRQLDELQRVVQTGRELSATKSLPNMPEVVSPHDNVEVALGRDSNQDTLSLRWRTVNGAASYTLQVSHNRLFVDNIIDAEGRTRASATIGLRRTGSYVWRVAALDAEGQRGPWSPAHRFRVVASEVAPASSAGGGPANLAGSAGGASR